MSKITPEHLGRAAVVYGRDGGVIAEALARHAPQVRVVSVDLQETGPVQVMDAVVTAARELAPEPRVAASTRTTRERPARFRNQAHQPPIVPPPTTTASADCGRLSVLVI